MADVKKISAEDEDLVWAMIRCFEPMEKMIEMSGLKKEDIILIAEKNNMSLDY